MHEGNAELTEAMLDDALDDAKDTTLAANQHANALSKPNA